MTLVEFHHGDNRDVLRRLIDQGVRVHSCCTDPPYGLTSVVKRFGKEGSAPAKFGSDGAFARVGAGFMGNSWDGTGIERDPEFWRLIWEILLPGGYCMAFSSPRTGHWQACAMDVAGFIMHPFHGWAYGQGFPKAHNAARAIDEALGVKGSKVAAGEPVRRIRPGADQNKDGSWEKLEDREYQPGQYVPGSPEGATWDGWFYGTQSTKPALEPIYVGQRPFDQKNGALNILKHGVGAVNIDACRVPGAPPSVPQPVFGVAKGVTNFGAGEGRNGEMSAASGRWPANLLHDGSTEVVALFPKTPGQLVRSSSSETRKNQNVYGEMSRGSHGAEPRGDEGSAARFFNAFPPEEPGPLFYQGKATKADRAGSKHPTVKPIPLMRWLCRLVTPPGGLVLDPFAGSGTTAVAAIAEGFRPILIEAHDQYAADIRRRFNLETVRAPTDLDAESCALLGIPANDSNNLEYGVEELLG